MRGQPGTGAARRALWPALALTVLVIAAAGLSGTAHFTGARWYPHGSTGNPRANTTPILRGTSTTTKPPRVKPRRVSTSWLPVVVIVVFLIILARLLWRGLRGRRLAPSAPAVALTAAGVMHARSPEPEPEPARLVTGIELALQALREEPEPADAVVRAWLGLQETAEESGIRRGAAETPTEFAERVLTRPFADPAPLRTLLRLYLRTRFGDHPVTAEDVSAVGEALQQLLERWNAIADDPTAAGARSR